MRNDDGNPNQSQQHLDLDTSSNLLNNTFVPLEDDTLTLVTGKQIEGHENLKKKLSKMQVQCSAQKSHVCVKYLL